MKNDAKSNIEKTVNEYQRSIACWPLPPIRRSQIIILIILALASLILNAQNPFIKLYTTADGLPSNKIIQMYQDSKKFIWFATDAGLVRYDGSTFTPYQKKDGLSDYIVQSIHEDASGRIWLQCSNGRWNFFYNNKIYNESHAPFLDSLKDLNTFPHNSDDIMYFYHPSKYEIYALDADNRISEYKIPEGITIKNLSKTPGGEYLIATQSGFIRTRTLSGINFESATKNFYRPYDWIMPIGKEIIFERVYFTKPLEVRMNKYVKYVNGIRNDSVEFPGQLSIMKCFEDSNGMLWISTWIKGVFCLKDKKIVDSLDIAESADFMEDHEGNIWISAKRGVFKINPGYISFKHYDISNFNNEGIRLLRSGIETGVWFSTGGRTIYLLKNNKIYDCDRWSERCNQICVLKNDFLIYGNKTLHLILEGISTDDMTGKLLLKYCYVVDTLVSNFSSVAVKKTRKEFCGAVIDFKGTNKDEIGIYSINKEIKLESRVLVGDGGVWNIFYDAHDNLIINSVKNNYYLRDNKLIPDEDLNRFRGKKIHLNLCLINSTDLIYTEDDSIYLINNHKVYNLTSFFNYNITPRVNRIIYEEPSLYLSNRRNIFKCDYPQNIIDNKPVQLQLIDINFRNIHDILVKNDTLYVASDDGLTIIPEVMLGKIISHTPIPYFQSVMVNDSSIDISRGEISLKENNKIRFQYGYIAYSSTPIEFSYMLENLDKNWTTGTGTNVVYQNLSRGKYIFKIRARKATMEWSEPIEFRIAIRAHFW